MTNNKTPRTDAQYKEYARRDNNVKCVDIDFARTLERELAEAQKENDILRAMAYKLMPCHYCGVDSIGKCPHGFPGCALMDDLYAAEETTTRELREVKAQLTLARKELEGK